jgi:adenylyl cyclase-associated protein
MSEFHSLANLIKRLEVATTRLEDLAMSSSSASAVASSSPPAIAPAAPTIATSSDIDTIPAAVEKHDAAVNGPLEKYIELAQELGGAIAEQVKISRYRKQNRYLTLCVCRHF